MQPACFTNPPKRVASQTGYLLGKHQVQCCPASEETLRYRSFSLLPQSSKIVFSASGEAEKSKTNDGSSLPESNRNKSRVIRFEQ
jgi:hypothetical protein